MKYIQYVIIISIFSSCVSSRYAGNRFPDPFEYSLNDTLIGHKDSILNKAHIWMADHLSNGFGGLNMFERKSGRINGTVLMSSSSDICFVSCVTQKYSASFTMLFTAREGGYQLLLSNFVVLKNKVTLKGQEKIKTISLNRKKHPSYIMDKAWNNIKDDCDKTSQKIFTSFKEHMHSPS